MLVRNLLTIRKRVLLLPQARLRKYSSTMMKNNDVSTTAPIQSVFTGPPTLSLIPPGKCQLTADFSSLPLLDRWAVSSTTSVLRFGVPDVTKPLNLSTCACILAKANVVVSEGDELEGEAVIRPYTPISTNAQIGSFDLLVKVSIW